MEHGPLSLESASTYKKSALAALKEQLEKHYSDLSLVSLDELEITNLNVYPNLKQLKDLSHDEIIILDEKEMDITLAEETVLNGEFFFEHACAGEATRLGLGTKYLVNLRDLSISKISKIMEDEKIADMKKDRDLEKSDILIAKQMSSEERVKELCGGDTSSLANLSLGSRHMLQLAFDIKKLADKHKRDWKEVLKKQSLLIVLNEQTSNKIIDNFIKYNFFGFDQSQVYFMIQMSFHGIHVMDKQLVYDEQSVESKRLHNHGQMYMQKTHNNSVFYIKDSEKVFLKSSEFETVLSKHKDLLSYNIEDIGYLTSSIDYYSLAKALELGEQGFEMVMEIVSQNPDKPQKGGAAFYDPILAKNVMIESNRLLDLRNEEIKHLNKNFNHYPMPAKSWSKVKENGLHMCYAVKKTVAGKAYLYPCPVQGDINLLVKTAFLMRKELKPIQAWKSPATTPDAVKAMFEQDGQEGFLDFVKLFVESE